MGKYRRLTKRRNPIKRGGFTLPGVGSISLSDLAPAGFPTSVSDLKSLVTTTVTQIPVLQTVAGAVGTISGVAGSLSSVSTTLTGLPALITSKVNTLVNTQLARAGITLPDITTSSETPSASGTVTTSGSGESGSGYGESGSGYGESGSGYGESGSGYGDNGSGYGDNGSAYGETVSGYGDNGSAYGETASGGGKTQDIGSAPFSIEQVGSGSAKYELVTLSKPVSDPLFVYYKSGKPIYFTRGKKGVTILTNRSSSHTTRRRYKSS